LPEIQNRHRKIPLEIPKGVNVSKMLIISEFRAEFHYSAV